MAYDAAAMLHNSGANLTATVTGTGKKVESLPFDGIWCRVSVPAIANAADTLIVTIQESDDDSSYNTIVTFATITGAAAAGVYRRRVSSQKKYVRAVLTVAGGAPNFGKVQVGFETGGEQHSNV